MLITRKQRVATAAWFSISYQRDVDDLIVLSLGPIATDKRRRVFIQWAFSFFFLQAPGVIQPFLLSVFPLRKSSCYCSCLPSTICLSTTSCSLSLEHCDASSLGDSIRGSARLGPLGSHHSSMHFPKQPAPGHRRGSGEIYLIKCL